MLAYICSPFDYGFNHIFHVSFSVFSQAQKFLGVYYSEDSVEQPKKAVHYMKMAADQQVSETGQKYFDCKFKCGKLL